MSVYKIPSPFILIPLLLLALILTACGNSAPTPNATTPSAATPPAATTAQPSPSAPAGPSRATTPPPATRPQSATIALLLADSGDDRTRQARELFIQAATSATTTVTVSDAAGDADKQKAQVNDALAKGAPVLVIQPVDQDAAAAFVDAAHKAGSQVIAFDRLVNTRDLDAYVSYDYFKAGQIEAGEAVRWLTANKTKTPWNFVILEGRAGDSVSAEITRGYYDVLKSLIDKKQVVVTVDQAHSEGTGEQSRKTTLDALTKTNNNVAAVLANSAALARGAIDAIDTQKLTGKVYVAGAGADIDSVRAVCGGQLNLAIWLQVQPLATTAAKLAGALAQGRSIGETGLASSALTVADKQVPLARVPVSPVSLDTVQAMLVQSGLVSPQQLGKCAPPLRDGVTVPKVSLSGSLTVWTNETPEMYAYLANLAAQLGDANPGVTLKLVNLDPDTLSQRFQTSALSSDSPDLLWTSGDQGAAFAQAELIQPIDGWMDATKFVSVTNNALVLNGKQYGVPVQVADMLVLYYNKKLIKEPPQDTAALLRLAPTLSKAEAQQWTLMWNQTEADYVFPWLAGFKGRVFGDDGRTPLLASQPMSDTLALLKQWRDQKVSPADADGEATDTAFRQGKTAMVVNGEWALDDYAASLGDNLGVARLPQVTKTKEYARPFASGRYLLAPKRLSGDKLALAQAFAQLVTQKPIQLEMASKFHRLPALREALADGAITNDPLLKGLADQAQLALPFPPTKDMTCILNAIGPNVAPVLSGKTNPGDASQAMQDSAAACIGKP